MQPLALAVRWKNDPDNWYVQTSTRTFSPKIAQDRLAKFQESPDFLEVKIVELGTKCTYKYQ